MAWENLQLNKLQPLAARSLVGLVKNNSLVTATKIVYKYGFIIEEGRIKSVGIQEVFIEIIKLGLKGVIDSHQGRKVHKTWRF